VTFMSPGRQDEFPRLTEVTFCAAIAVFTAVTHIIRGYASPCSVCRQSGGRSGRHDGQR
jgi:hypothetical protein